ncbi:MAG: NAD(P)-dependent oxidoreductase [Thermodesulfobacteriota bacterium]
MIKTLLSFEPTALELEAVKNSFPSDCEIVVPQDWSEEGLIKLVEDEAIEIIVGRIRKPMLKAIKAAKKLRLIQATGHGIDSILRDQTKEILIERNISVAKSSPSAINISEFVMMCLVALSRRVFKLHEALAYRGNWSAELKKTRIYGSLGGELFGRVLGIISLGRIGVEVAKRAKAFGMEMMAIQKKPQFQSAQELGIGFLGGLKDIEKVIKESDYIVLSLPLTEETRGLIGRREFKMMKDGAYIVNISRGSIIDLEALYEALKSGKLAGAAIDVWESEEEKTRLSHYPLDRPIHQYNVIMTPHYSGLTKENRLRAITIAGENIRRLIKGEPLKNLADLGKGY